MPVFAIDSLLVRIPLDEPLPVTPLGVILGRKRQKPILTSWTCSK